jgi:CubicO group peptidase (beta-lactamase class C family)
MILLNRPKIANQSRYYRNFVKVAIIIMMLSGTYASASDAHRAATMKPEELSAYIDSSATTNGFSGVILVARDEKIIYHKAYGNASREYKVPITVNTRFNLGSLNKSFTVTAISQLLDQKKISLDDPIGKYLTEFPSKVADAVTIRHLVQQTAGWGDYWDNPQFLKKLHNVRTVSEYIAFIKDMPLDSEPGTKRQHCNTCFEVLGAIIEKVSGKNYFDYVRENIYKPAKMLSSDSYERNGIIENLAQGYAHAPDAQEKGKLINNIYILPVRGTPAGGGYSTAEDLFKYVTALRKNMILSSEYTKLMLNGFKTEEGSKGKAATMMAGLAAGVNTFLGFQYPAGVTVIILSNQNEPDAIAFGESLM